MEVLRQVLQKVGLLQKVPLGLLQKVPLGLLQKVPLGLLQKVLLGLPQKVLLGLPQKVLLGLLQKKMLLDPLSVLSVTLLCTLHDPIHAVLFCHNLTHAVLQPCMNITVQAARQF